MTPNKYNEFFADLRAVYKKHGMHIAGCGDCGSPWIAGPNASDFAISDVIWREDYDKVDYTQYNGHHIEHMTRVFND